MFVYVGKVKSSRW